MTSLKKAVTRRSEERARDRFKFRRIACHTWDTLGAVAAGWRAALIKRVGNDVLGVGPQPQIIGNDLNDVADQLIARH
jgi:2-haloacid dehalogenase